MLLVIMSCLARTINLKLQVINFTTNNFSFQEAIQAEIPIKFSTANATIKKLIQLI